MSIELEYDNELLANSLENIWRIAENNLCSKGDTGLAEDLKALFSEHLPKLSEADQMKLSEAMESWGA